MKVRVIRAKEDSFWYAQHVGEVFEVEEWNARSGKEYRVLPYEGFSIDADDCEIVEE